MSGQSQKTQCCRLRILSAGHQLIQPSWQWTNGPSKTSTLTSSTSHTPSRFSSSLSSLPCTLLSSGKIEFFIDFPRHFHYLHHHRHCIIAVFFFFPPSPCKMCIYILATHVCAIKTQNRAIFSKFFELQLITHTELWISYQETFLLLLEMKQKSKTTSGRELCVWFSSSAWYLCLLSPMDRLRDLILLFGEWSSACPCFISCSCSSWCSRTSKLSWASSTGSIPTWRTSISTWTKNTASTAQTFLSKSSTNILTSLHLPISWDGPSKVSLSVIAAFCGASAWCGKSPRFSLRICCRTSWSAGGMRSFSTFFCAMELASGSV